MTCFVSDGKGKDIGADRLVAHCSVSVKGLALMVSEGREKDMGGNRLVAHCSVSVNGRNIKAQVDTGANACHVLYQGYMHQDGCGHEKSKGSTGGL